MFYQYNKSHFDGFFQTRPFLSYRKFLFTHTCSPVALWIWKLQELLFAFYYLIYFYKNKAQTAREPKPLAVWKLTCSLLRIFKSPQTSSALPAWSAQLPPRYCNTRCWYTNHCLMYCPDIRGCIFYDSFPVPYRPRLRPHGFFSAHSEIFHAVL